MSSFGIEFHPEALAEARAAKDWYHERSPEIAEGFGRDIAKAIDVISEGPFRWPETSQGVRRYVLRRFPFLIVYKVVDSLIYVIAVAHGRRLPGYWRDRR
ncbi:MAG: type II toxin-antitoxin system RelE/ParE family toxin [Deltaproteobacteria bacterium]|nr:type II toxin-antitoxin system RelE/ParE family toxin [Deltaproteobacteria bacterium]